MDVEPRNSDPNINPETSSAFQELIPQDLRVSAALISADESPVSNVTFEASESGLEKSFTNFTQKRGANRAKTGLRLRYEAEVSVIQKQIGSLEKVRADLGLSARKICQLLMVDPSAWNRWSSPGGKAPPHIWRALQWYIIAQEKLPGLTPNFFLARPMPSAESKIDPQVAKQVQGIESSHKILHQRIQALEDQSTQLVAELKTSQRTVRVYEMAGAMIGLMILGFVIFLFLRSRG